MKLLLDKSRMFWLPLTAALFFSLLSGPGLHVAAADSSSVNFLVTPNPLFVKIKKIEPIGRRHHSSRQRKYRLSAVVTNKGDSSIGRLRVRLILPPNLKVKKNMKRLAILPGKKDRKFTWKLKMPETGNYLVQIKAAGVITESGQAVSTAAFRNISLAQHDEDDRDDRTKEMKWSMFPGYDDFFDFASLWHY